MHRRSLKSWFARIAALLCLALLAAGGAGIAHAQQPPLETGLHYFLIENLATGQVVLRGTAGSNGVAYDAPLILAPNTRHRQWVLQAATFRVGTYEFTTPNAGSRISLPPIFLFQSTSLDPDSDGLHDEGEFILDTSMSNPDTDGDGIEDGPEVRQGLNPLDGLVARTGIITTADTPGTAADIAALNDVVVIADSAAGVSVFSAVTGMNPVAIAQVDTLGSAQAVALDDRFVAVADGFQGLAIIDISDPPAARVIHQVNFGGNVRAVAASGGVGYVGTSLGQLAAVDLATGTVLAEFSVLGSVVDLALAGDELYVLTSSSLFIYRTLEGGLEPLSNILVEGGASPVGAGRRLFVGGGLAYVGHQRGYSVVDVSLPASPQVIGASPDFWPSAHDIAANGSGLVLTCGPELSPVGVYDGSDPTDVTRLLTVFNTPGLCHSLSIFNGLAYVADGPAGLQVINYLAYDSQGVPPDIELTSNFAPGKAEEGRIMRVTANVDDDVQVRNVEFFVDGRRVVTDGTFPFEHRFVTPLIAQQPSFTLQARATDTGGNVAETEVMVITLERDATPPRARVISPSNRSNNLPGSVAGISISFSKPIDLGTLTSATLRLFSAGPDGIVGNEDDQPVPGGVVTYRESTNTALLTFGVPLAPDLYRAVAGSSIADRVGNALGSDFVWTFDVGRAVEWVANTSGSWHNPANWSTGNVPQENDIVIIDVPADITVTYSQGTTLLMSLRSEEAIVLSFGTLTLNAASEINDFTLSGGTFTGTGDLTVPEAFRWTGGTMSGRGSIIITEGAALEISTTAFRTLLGRTIDNFGAALWTNGQISMGQGAVFNNQPGATFDAQTDDDIFLTGGGDPPQFNNLGSFRKTQGTTTTRILAVFNNSGSASVQSGSVALEGGGRSDGDFEIDEGAALDFVSGIHTLEDGATFTGAGFGRVAGGTVFVGDGPTDVVTAQSFEVATGTLDGPGALTITDTFRWTGGTIRGAGVTTIAEGAALDISGTAFRTLLERTIDHFGTAVWTEGQIFGGQGAVFNNQPGATFDAQTDDDIFLTGGGAAPRFNNLGSFRKTQGTTTRILAVFNNSGSVSAQSGIVALEGGGRSNGDFAVAGGAALDFVSGIHTLEDGASFTGVGFARVAGATVVVGDSPTDVVTAQSFGVATGTLDGPGALTITDTFRWTGGTIRGAGVTTIAEGAALDISGTAFRTLLERTIDHFGDAVWTEGQIFGGQGAVFNNQPGATFEVQTDADIFLTGGGAAPRFNNLGSFRKTQGASTNSTRILAVFNNSGSVSVQSGTLAFEGAYTQTAGSTILNGGSLSSTTSLGIQGGRLSGFGSITGSVSSAGEVSPGLEVGALSISGSYTQQPGGVLDIEISGLSAGTEFDQLSISGPVNLAGNLNITLVNSFEPDLGDSFQIMAFGSRNGEFTDVNGLDIGGGKRFQLDYTASAVTLTVISTE